LRLDVAAVAASAEEGLEVLVLEPGGAPSPGAVVTLARADDDRIALATSAGEDGRVVLAKEMGLAGAPVTVRVRSGGRAASSPARSPHPGQSPSARARRRDRRSSRVSGAAPRSLVVEVASQPAASGWRTTDVHRFAGARFSLADLPSGPVRLTVRADDGRRGAAELTLAAGETRALGSRSSRPRGDAQVESAATISGSRAPALPRAKKPRGERAASSANGFSSGFTSTSAASRSNASRPICMGRFVAPLVPTTSRRSAVLAARSALSIR
jgi:hypothetical protein